MRAVLVLVVSLLVTACRTPVPVFAPLPEGDHRGAALLQSWSSAVGDRETLRAVARLAVDGSGRNTTRLRVRQDLWLSRPMRLRVEILSPLRTSLGVLITDGVQYSLDTADGSREMGSVHDTLLWEVARLDLTPAQAVDVILGFPSVAEGLRPGRGYRGPEGRVRVDLHAGTGKRVRQLEFDALGRLLAVGTPGLSERAVQRVEFSDYAPVAGGPFAHRVRIEDSAGIATLLLSGVVLNPVLPPETFLVEGRRSGEGG